jgi:hypothetical protein
MAAQIAMLGKDPNLIPISIILFTLPAGMEQEALGLG